MKVIFSLICLTLSSISFEIQAESQTSIVFEYLKKNAIPSFYGRDSSQDALYQHYIDEVKLKDNTTELSSTSPCHSNIDALQILSTDSIQSYQKLTSAICTNPEGGSKNCTCEAWGSCSNCACECNVLCPDNFKILDRKPKNDLNLASGISSYTNSDPELSNDISDYQGFCWGFAVLNQKLSKLAFFNTKKSNTTLDKGTLDEKERYINFLINKIDKNEPIEIDGFRNIEEFTKISIVQNKLLPIVAKYWGKNAVSLQGLNSVSPTGIFVTKKDITNAVNDTQQRINNFQNPALVITTTEGTLFKDAHVVIASSVSKIQNGSTKICVVDNNFKPENTDKCKNFLLIDNGKIKYHIGDSEIKEITRLQVAHHENAMVTQFVKSLRQQCLDQKECNNK